jgi:HEAT repeat protein
MASSHGWLLSLALGVMLSIDCAAQSSASKGQTAAAKIDFLRALDRESQQTHDRSIRDRHYLDALSDSSPDVRKFAAYGLRGDQYLPALINVLVSDKDPAVRLSAALSMTHWTTDNGVETCTGLEPISANLDKLLVALQDAATARYVAEILGGRHSGEKPLPCCMPPKERQRILAILQQIDMPRGSSIASQALRNIGQCSP